MTATAESRNPLDLRGLFAPLRGASRFFADPRNGADLAPVLTRFALLLVLGSLLMTGIDAFGRWLSADLHAAVDRVIANPHSDPLLPPPWSEIASAAAFVLVWLIYVSLFAALRGLGARLLPGAATAFREQYVYAIFAAIPLVCGAVIVRAVGLATLPVDPEAARLPGIAATWLPPVIFILTLSLEAWIVSRALVIRHSARPAFAFAIWAAPLLCFAALFAFYLLAFAIFTYPA